MKTFSVYILECSNGAYYTGRTTKDVEDRVYEHNLGTGSDYTKRRRPVRLLAAWDFETEDEAYTFEFQVKRWTRAKKEALINGDFELLRELAKNYTLKKNQKKKDVDSATAA